MDCYPWDSRRRRLFPQRRPSFPNFAKSKAKATPDFPHFGSLPSRDHFRGDHDEIDSDVSSQSSIESATTTQIRLSSTSDRPFPRTDPTLAGDAPIHVPCLAGSSPRLCKVDPPNSSYKSSGKLLGTSRSAPLSEYTNESARENFQWKPNAHFHEARHMSRQKITSRRPNGEQVLCFSGKSRDPLVRANEASKCELPLGTNPCYRSLSPKITAHRALPSFEVSQNSSQEEHTCIVTKSNSCLSTPVHKIDSWDCNVTLSTVVTMAVDGRLHVHHLAHVSVTTPVTEIDVDKVNLCLLVVNALRTDCKCNLMLGQSSIMFQEDVSQAGFFPRQGVELAIVRNSCDLEKPFNLYFAFTYPSPQHFVMTSLPTFRPKQGRSLSEVVFIAEPRPPLSLRTYVRDSLSSWALCHHPLSQVTCYKRINTLRPHAAHFQDDIQMRVLELDPVRFQALGQFTPADMIWKLDITVHELPGQQPECRMSFFVEVGASTAIVSLNTHGWVPQYFIIDGCMATEKVGECWEGPEGKITIFKQSHTRAGPIWVETYWQGLSEDDSVDIHRKGDLRLPEVADRKVFGGRLVCRETEGMLLAANMGLS